MPSLTKAQLLAEVETLRKALENESAKLKHEAAMRQALERTLTEALEQQTATSEILKVISSSPTDLQPVMDAVAENAARLCDASDAQILRVDGETITLVASYGRLPTITTEPRRISRRLVGGRAIIDRMTLHIPDVRVVRDEFPDSATLKLGVRTVLATPLRREDVAIGVIMIRRMEVRPFSDKQVQLLQTFADQAVIAIENVRLFKELEERNRELTTALDQQTATSGILRVISSSPTDVQPVFDSIAQSVRRLCRGTTSAVLTYDGKLIHLVALSNVNPEGTDALRQAFPRPPSRATTTTRAILTGKVVMIPDVLEDPDYALTGPAQTVGFRNALAVPMLREGKTIGGISVMRAEPGPFSESEIELLKTFADQAVIAIENVRLFKELEAKNADLTEALEQQTATSEILRIISSSPTDIQPIFDTIVQSAVRLCDGLYSVVIRFDGELMHIGASYNYTPEVLQAVRQMYPMPPSRQQLSGRVILTRAVVHIEDVLDDLEYRQHVARAGGWRAMLGVPMLREGNPIGMIGVLRGQPGPFSETQIELLKTFADQAVIAIENVRLFTELQQKNEALTQANAQVSEALERQTAMSEILRVISSSPTDVQPVFGSIAESVRRLCRGTASAVYSYDGKLIHLVAVSNVNPEGADAWRQAFPRPPSRATATARAILTGEVVMIPDVLQDPEYALTGAAQTAGFRSCLAVPMLREGKVIGGIAGVRAEPGPFSQNEIGLLKTFADQAVIAIENVRLFTELQEKNRAVTEALEQQTTTSEILRVISMSSRHLRRSRGAHGDCATLPTGWCSASTGNSSISRPTTISPRNSWRRSAAYSQSAPGARASRPGRS